MPSRDVLIGALFTAAGTLASFMSPPPVACNAPWVSAVVESDGAVRPCFFHEPVGNLADGTLAEIVNSPKARAFRGSLDIRRDPICRTCVCTLKL